MRLAYPVPTTAVLVVQLLNACLVEISTILSIQPAENVGYKSHTVTAALTLLIVLIVTWDTSWLLIPCLVLNVSHPVLLVVPQGVSAANKVTSIHLTAVLDARLGAQNVHLLVCVRPV